MGVGFAKTTRATGNCRAEPRNKKKIRAGQKDLPNL